MDSPEDSPGKNNPNDESSSSDNNANRQDQSKGAIPKVRATAKAGTSKKTVKVNNNIESMHTLNLMGSVDILKKNGFVKNLAMTKIINDEDNLKEQVDDFDSPSLLNGPFKNLLNASSDLSNDDIKNDSDSSSEDNELLSVSDDGCIYTYKGDNVADLPSSFFNLELPLEPADVGEERQGNSSPEMDFLEMDFDPGPSGDADDSDSVSQSDVENVSVLPLDMREQIPPDPEPQPSCSKTLVKVEATKILNNNNYAKCAKAATNLPKQSEVIMPWSCSIAERTQNLDHLRTVVRHHSSKGELTSPSEYYSPSGSDSSFCNFSSFHKAFEKASETKQPFFDGVEEIMLWSVAEASNKQVTQIGPSSCGATAALNVLSALGLPTPPVHKMREYVSTNPRANSAPLTEYLQSRSVAGCSHREIISGLYKASEGRVYARFFSMFPERIVNLHKWLGFWIRHGAVPVATLNLQRCEGKIPDSWHHQMIFGVNQYGICLTNPLECVEGGLLWPQLTSESVLLIRRQDIVSRWNVKTDLPQLMKIEDVRWKNLNVVGQVAKVIREKERESRVGSTITSHVQIPAQYKTGITLAIDVNSSAFPLLQGCPELPLLYPDGATGSF